jgi:hypothetical protein
MSRGTREGRHLQLFDLEVKVLQALPGFLLPRGAVRGEPPTVGGRGVGGSGPVGDGHTAPVRGGGPQSPP